MKTNTKRFSRGFLAGFLLLLFAALTFAQKPFSVKEYYNKAEYRIPMRDGVKLYTIVYTPKDTTVKYPILLWRTPYSCGPYGPGKYRRLPDILAKEKFIFVYQDVRGRFMSGGTFVNMRPYIENKTSNKQVDESSDAYDTEGWLVKHVKDNNGKIGIFGISYPGFYAAMACIDANPALKAASPQAPISNWFIDDDFHRHGAFVLPMFFNFYQRFGVKRDSLITQWPKGLSYASPDAYDFFLGLEPLSKMDKKYFHGQIAFWETFKKHPNYDTFWQKRNTLPHFHKVKPAVMTVGGWFDSEDFYGTLHTYDAIHKNNPNGKDYLVIGPWPHGWWAATPGYRVGQLTYGSNTGDYYRQNIQLPFFKYYLKGEGSFNQSAATMFNTGTMKWESFNQWPPRADQKESLYLSDDHALVWNHPDTDHPDYNEYVSDPWKPVPYTDQEIDSRQMYYHGWLNGDQRFASTRPDVLVYTTPALQKDVTLTGPLLADLFVSTTGTDADWVVKIIDVYPDSAANPVPNPDHIKMGGFQALVRLDIMRGKYRNSYEHPDPFVPGKVTEVKLPLQDVFHTFKKGHKIMVQIQSSCFPFFDINPQTFTDIYSAKKKDFIKATQKVYFSKEYPSRIEMDVLK